MKKEADIIREIIETARKIERVQAKKDHLESMTEANDIECIKAIEIEQEILDKDIEICSLGEKLNAFVWLFE